MALVSNITAKQIERRMLTRRFQVALKEDRRCRVRRLGEYINSLVENNQPIEVWIKTQRCYR